MKASEIIKSIMKDRKWSRETLAQEVGYKRQSNIGALLDRGASMRVDNLVKLVEAMGCEVVVRDKMGDRKEWRITE